MRTKKAGGVEVTVTDVFRAFIADLHECHCDTYRLLNERLNQKDN